MFIVLLLVVVVATKSWMHIGAWMVWGCIIALLVSALYGSYLSDQDDNTAWVWIMSACGGFWLLLGLGALFVSLFVSWKERNEPDDSSVANQEQA
jgi:hypothetical protein